MKKYTFFLISIILAGSLYAQNCEIDFAGTGASTEIDSVIIKNLTQDTTITLNGTDVLNLNIIAENSNTTGVFSNTSIDNSLMVFPNPMSEHATVQFEIKLGGIVNVEVIDISGRSVAKTNQILQPGIHKFRISGLNQGMYIVRINEQDSSYIAKLISRNNSNDQAQIEYVSMNYVPVNYAQTSQLKSTSSEIELSCNEGDRLMFTGMSGNYATVVTQVPSGNHTITFDFMECTDVDSNHYSVVTIGDQIWMAENLATTRYNDSTAIPLVASASTWAGLSTPAYAWFDNDSLTYKNVYGALYNWFAVDTASNGGKNVCPSGWHVPGADEMKQLTNYAGTGSANKLRDTGSEHWKSSSSKITNEYGFSALGGGWRTGQGEFANMHQYGVWWSSTDDNTENAKYFEIAYNNSSAIHYSWYKVCGFSIRCVKDE